MKLALIVSIWHDWDMLEATLKTNRKFVDGIIIVASQKSNYGELSPIPERWRDDEIYIYEPSDFQPRVSETKKRNYGLRIALEQGYTHFLTADADEVYHPEEVEKVKFKFEDANLNGLVVPSNLYFGKPTLTIGRDITRVPFIHKLTPTILHDFNKAYPFAWERNQIRIDPTRSLSINSGVEYTEDIVMHHYSWIRKDYEMKIRNSTARTNLERSTILEDLKNAAPGVFCNFYQKTLQAYQNTFGIPEF